MKFGDSLWQRSVPQWRTYNLDYGNIKKLIKEQTTPGKGKAISVPGHAADIAEDFEDQLLLVFYQEHERVSRFVKSKWYEINSRLGSIERQLHQVQRRKDGAEHMRNTVAVRRKAARIESDILNVGEEIQHLSRFISSNRLAIRKLLKKYRKWTGLTSLTSRVEAKILNQTGSFTQIQLDLALELYTAYLEAVRSPFKRPVPRQLSTLDLAQRRRMAARDARGSHAYLFEGSNLDFDLALAAQASGDRAQSATYWVHKDNAVELRILLLQFMQSVRLRADSTASKEGNTMVRRGSADETPSTVGSLVLDNAARVATADKIYGCSNGGDTSYASAIVRWNAEERVFFSITNATEESYDKLIHPAAMNFPRRRLAAFLDKDATFSTEDNAKEKEEEEEDDEERTNAEETTLDAEKARSWLLRHEEIEPLVFTRHTRSRFVGLENQADQAAWAVFDEDVEFGEVSLEDIATPSFFTHAPIQGTTFPHAILTVRTEGDCSNLLNALNMSHLTERVKGFSIERHALLTMCQERGMPKPSWYPRLEKDIRHIPEPDRSPSRKSSHLGLDSAAMTPQKGSRSGASDSEARSVRFEEENSESTRVDNKDTLKTRSMRRAKKEAESVETPVEQRYWNEYDHPEDGSDNGEFYIYLDPEAPLYPGQKELENLGRRIKSIFRRPKSAKDLERGASSTTDDGSASSSDEDDSSASVLKRSRKSHHTPLIERSTQTRIGYGTLSTTFRAAPANQHLVRTTTLCLLAAAIIFAILNVMVNTGRRKTRVEVHVVVLLGVIASIAFVGTAVGLWLRDAPADRRTRGGIIANVVVGVVAALIAAGDAWLLVNVLT